MPEILINGTGSEAQYPLRIDSDNRASVFVSGGELSISGTTVISGTVLSTDRLYTRKLVNLSSGQSEYIGEAEAGTNTGSALWRIKKMEYDNGNNMPPTSLVWASGNTNFDKIWTSRATYPYS